MPVSLLALPALSSLSISALRFAICSGENITWGKGQPYDAKQSRQKKYTESFTTIGWCRYNFRAGSRGLPGTTFVGVGGHTFGQLQLSYAGLDLPPKVKGKEIGTDSGEGRSRFYFGYPAPLAWTPSAAK
jgi:hypothetical protein